jgi:hypothetical protein
VKHIAKSKLARAGDGKIRNAVKPRSDKGLTATVPLAEMMKSPVVAPPLDHAEPLRESGVLAFRRKKNGKPLILLISPAPALQLRTTHNEIHIAGAAL